MGLTTLKPRVSKLDTRVGSPVVKRITGRELTRIRERIGIRDEFTCQVCHRFALHGEGDHRVPLHLGGAESDENRAWLCSFCHKSKNEREEKERGQ